MKYGYISYAYMKPEWMDRMDELPTEMARVKEDAEKHGFHMKYWGHPFGVAENIVVVLESEKDLGAYMKMNQSVNGPYAGNRTILASKN